MANSLLRNIAIGIGTGLAIGLGRTFGSRNIRRPVRVPSPILNRLEEIESRVELVELSPALNPPLPEEIAALGTLVSSQSEDIAGLRQEIQRIERRNAEQAEAFARRVTTFEEQIPAQIDAAIAARMNSLETRLRDEFQATHHRTVDTFVQMVETRVVGRITVLENSLVEQSNSISALREKSLKTDDNLQRLLDAVEKLCARTEAQAQAEIRTHPPEPPAPSPMAPSAPAATSAAESFATHYQRALAREIAVEEKAAAPLHSQNGRSGKVGVALLGLVVLGFRLLR